MKGISKGYIRRFIIKIHAYLGLLCMPYLLIFGLSSLDFNHHIKVLESAGEEIPEDPQTIIIPEMDENKDMAGAINDSSSIYGWYLPWTAVRDSLQFKYETSKMGRTYRTTVHFDSGKVDIVSWRSSFSQIIKGLHGLGEEMPGAPLWINLWQYYQDLSVYSILFWVVTGIWLWLLKKNNRIWGSIAFISLFIFSILLMIYIWLVG